MADDQLNSVRSRQDIQDALVNDPKNHNRREEVELLCEWRRAYERHLNSGYADFVRAFVKENENQPQAIRALNVLTQREGMNVFYRDTVEPEKKHRPDNSEKILSMVWLQARSKQILIPEKPLVVTKPEDLGIRRRPSDVTEQMSFGLGWHEELYDVLTVLNKPAYRH